MTEKFVKWAKERGWDIQLSSNSSFSLPDDLNDRYPNIPPEYIEFLKQIDSCVAPDDKLWFICLNDYEGRSNSVYSWDEIEKMSLCAAKGDNDWQEEITGFWDEHIPIILSVRDGYSYYALNVGSDFGTVVYGYEPEFEEAKNIATSFFEFLNEVITNKIKI